jgi:D-alanyl-D-alanine carboxypeptidase/D-alanyl-D-alanine-endopeptidase (penicillin-binding protein 4)
LLTLAAGCASHPVAARQAVPPPSRSHPTESERQNPKKPDRAVRELQQDLAAVFGAAIMSHAQWGVVVRSVDTGELLYELNPDKLMMPASNMKIVTLAGAAHVLDWNHRFVTTLETSAAVAGGVLLGDVIVRGGGDPTINSRNGRAASVFAEWATALRSAGIHRIAGRIVGDDQAFDDEGIGGGWAWDYLQFGYAAPVGALQYNEDVAALTVTPGKAAGDPAVVQLAAGAGLKVLNRAVTGAAGAPETIEYRRHLDRPVLEVFGTVPLTTPSPDAAISIPRTVGRQVAVVNPTVFFAQSLKDALVALDIAVDGSAIDLDEVEPEPIGAGAAERRVLARTESPTLREIAPVLMKVSQNLYAETLLKAAGTAGGGTGTVQAGRSAVLNALREWQIDEASLVLADGSGLSRYNYVTAGLLVKILARMYADPRHREPFIASLPIAGKDGTIATRMRRTRAEGNAVAKTGSISNVRSLSGYVRSRDGEMLVFSILANDFVIPAATVNWIADLGVELLANFNRKPSQPSQPLQQ